MAKVLFGLKAQGHIPAIEAEINRWNENYKLQFPDENPIDFTYSVDVWKIIGKKIGWCPFTAALSYLEYKQKTNQP